MGSFHIQCSAHVQNKDTGEIDDTLNELMMRLNETNPQDLVAEDPIFFRKILTCEEIYLRNAIEISRSWISGR